MKKIRILLLALVILCFCLTGCVAQAGEVPPSATETTGDITPEETEETAAEPSDAQSETQAFTMPDMEMPTKPDADYQLPPGEKPGGDPVTE